MTTLVAKLIWFAGVTGWFIIRYPYQRRSRRTPRLHRGPVQDRILLAVSATGLGLIPFAYVIGGFPKFADYPVWPPQVWCGAAVFAAALWLFRRTHKELGRNWSVTLEIRERHALITSGIYSRVRHPMYAAFWLWAVAQALLLPNWIAGPAGFVGFGTLFFLRVGPEERMMLALFGEEYRAYMLRTNRIFPKVFGLQERRPRGETP